MKARTAERRWMRNPVWPSSCVTPAGTSNELDVQNEWEENTHTTGKNKMIWVKDWNEDREDPDVDILHIIQKVQDTGFHLEVDEEQWWKITQGK